MNQPLDDRTYARDLIFEAVRRVKENMISRPSAFNTHGAAYALFFSAMCDLSDMTDAQRSNLVRQLLAETKPT